MAVEDLDAKGSTELPSNSRDRAGAARGTFLRMLEYKCDREGAHFVTVDPAGTTKECAEWASKPANRCGFGNTPVLPVGSKRTGMRTRR